MTAVAPNPVVRVDDLVYSRSPAGEVIIDCVALDGQDQLIPDALTRVQIRPLEGWAEADAVDGAYVGQVMGEYTVTCRELRSRISDESPELWTVTSGRVARTRAYLGEAVLEAGSSTEVWCEAEDAYGNSVNTETANILPESSTPNLARVEDGLVESERSGRYRIDCPSEGAEVIPAYLVIVSGPASRVIIDPQPNSVYPVV